MLDTVGGPFKKSKTVRHFRHASASLAGRNKIWSELV